MSYDESKHVRDRQGQWANKPGTQQDTAAGTGFAGGDYASEIADEMKYDDAFELSADDWDEADAKRQEINRQGGYSLIEVQRTFREDDVHDGQPEYLSEDYTVRGFHTGDEMREYLGRQRTVTSDGRNYYDSDGSQVIDHAEGLREERSFVAAKPDHPNRALTDDELDEATDHSAIAAAWQATDEDGESYEHLELDDEGKAVLREELRDFQQAYPDLLDEARERGYGGAQFPQQFGHSFTLGAMGHGVGFADDPVLSRDDLGKRLDEAARRRRTLEHADLYNEGGPNLSMDGVQNAHRNRDHADAYYRKARDEGKTAKEISAQMSRDMTLGDLSYRARRELDEQEQ